MRYELLAGDLGDYDEAIFEGKVLKSGPVAFDEACRAARKFLDWAYHGVVPKETVLVPPGEEWRSAVIPGWTMSAEPLRPIGRMWRVSVEPFYQVTIG
ncbi:MAG: hypothetical protein V3W28_06070 [Thermoplasmata archaeon]